MAPPPRPASFGVIRIPDPSLVVLIGAAGAGKSTFAARHFRPDEVLSSDAFRALLSGSEADQSRTRTVFSILHREVVRRLAAGRMVVIDATNVEAHARRQLVSRARSAGVPAVAVVFALDAEIVHARNVGRTGRVVDPSIVDRHLRRLSAALAGDSFAEEGFAAIHVLLTATDLDAVRIERLPASR